MSMIIKELCHRNTIKVGLAWKQLKIKILIDMNMNL